MFISAIARVPGLGAQQRVPRRKGIAIAIAEQDQHGDIFGHRHRRRCHVRISPRAAHYRKNPRVEIMLDPSDFFFYRFGQTLLGAFHGHKMKPDRMAMAVMRRADWGRTRFHHFMFGHIRR